MKVSNLPLGIMACAVLALTGIGCKKTSDSSTPVKTTGSNINPVTTQIIPNYNFNDTTLTNNGWQKTFEDNFDTDLSKWSIYKGGGQEESECYETANAQVTDGILQIIAKKQQVTGATTVGSDSTKSFNYTSAWIVSKTSISANIATPRLRIVARIKVASGYGLTSNFWSFGGSWPTNGEIDFAGILGNNTQSYATNYFYGTAVNKSMVTNGEELNPTNGDLSASFHVYEMEWSQNSLKSYIDGQLVETKTDLVPSLFGKTEYLSFNLSVGGLYYSNFVPANVQPGTMYVDYVKVFTSGNAQ